MISFSKRLERARIEKNLSIDDVSKAIKIKASFLEAIEKGEYDKLPSQAYVLGFVKNYIAFLDLPRQESLALFRREFDEKKNFAVLPRGLVGRNEFPIQRIMTAQTFVVLLFFFFAFFLYLLFQYRFALFSPSLTLGSPRENETFSSNSIHVSGKADSSAIVTIDNKPIVLANDGSFSKDITVFPGKITIHIKARNSFGKESIIDRHILVKSGL